MKEFIKKFLEVCFLLVVFLIIVLAIFLILFIPGILAVNYDNYWLLLTYIPIFATAITLSELYG
jgi:hypothetical protein